VFKEKAREREREIDREREREAVCSLGHLYPKKRSDNDY